MGKFLWQFSEGFTNKNLNFIKLLWGRSVLSPLQYAKGIETQMLCLRLVLLWDQEDGSQTSFIRVLSLGIPMKVIWLLPITRVNVITVSQWIPQMKQIFFPICILQSRSIPVPYLVCLTKAQKWFFQYSSDNLKLYMLKLNVVSKYANFKIWLSVTAKEIR